MRGGGEGETEGVAVGVVPGNRCVRRRVAQILVLVGGPLSSSHERDLAPAWREVCERSRFSALGGLVEPVATFEPFRGANSRL